MLPESDMFLCLDRGLVSRHFGRDKNTVPAPYFSWWFVLYFTIHLRLLQNAWIHADSSFPICKEELGYEAFRPTPWNRYKSQITQFNWICARTILVVQLVVLRHTSNCLLIMDVSARSAQSARTQGGAWGTYRCLVDTGRVCKAPRLRCPHKGHH